MSGLPATSHLKGLAGRASSAQSGINLLLAACFRGSSQPLGAHIGGREHVHFLRRVCNRRQSSMELVSRRATVGLNLHRTRTEQLPKPKHLQRSQVSPLLLFDGQHAVTVELALSFQTSGKKSHLESPADSDPASRSPLVSGPRTQRNWKKSADRDDGADPKVKVRVSGLAQLVEPVTMPAVTQWFTSQ